MQRAATAAGRGSPRQAAAPAQRPGTAAADFSTGADRGREAAPERRPGGDERAPEPHRHQSRAREPQRGTKATNRGRSAESWVEPAAGGMSASSHDLWACGAPATTGRVTGAGWRGQLCCSEDLMPVRDLRVCSAVTARSFADGGGASVIPAVVRMLRSNSQRWVERCCHVRKAD